MGKVSGHVSSFSEGPFHEPTPAELRKHAKRLEKRAKAAKAEANRRRREAEAKAAAHATARQALVDIAGRSTADPGDRIAAARTLRELF